MTKEEWSAQLKSLFPSEINGIVRPIKGIPADLDFSADFPQFISQDPARYDSWNAFLRQLFSNDALFQKWITELQTALANQDFALATQQIKGLMSADDKAKLDNINNGAEVNQNAFSNVQVGNTTIQADSKTDTLTFVAGDNVTLTPDVNNDKITIASKDTKYDIVSTSTAGLVPIRDGSTTKFFRSDGAWASIPIPSSIDYVNNDASSMRFHWSGKDGQPSWLWGGSDPSNMYVYNPSNFNVNYANSAGNANTVGGLTVDQIKTSGVYIVKQQLGENGYIVWSNGKIEQWGKITSTKAITVENPFNIIFTNSCSWVESEIMWQTNIDPRTPYTWSNTGFKYYAQQASTSPTNPVKWYAIGY